MSDHRPGRWALVGARAVAGAAVAAGVVVAVVAAVAVPWPGVARSPVTVEATPAPDASVVACAGPLLALGRDASQAGLLAVAAPQQVTVGVAPGDPSATSSRLSVEGVSGEHTALTFTAPPAGDAPADLAASGSAQVEAEDLRGLAVSGCRPPLPETWLVGGATTTGSSDLVVLSNPGQVPSTVQITVYGAKGAQTSPGGSGVVVPPGSQRVVPLAGLLLGEESPVVRVTATGAPVQATLQSSLTRTLVPGGVEQIGPAPGPASDVVIPGLLVPASATGSPGDVTTVLRLLSPAGGGSATITVAAVGGAAVSTDTIPLTESVPAQVDLSGLAAGVYTVSVTADQPIVAAAWQATGLGAGSDFAWYAAAPEVSGDTVVAIPAGPSPLLVLANASSQSATVTLQIPGATPVPATVPARGSASIPLTPGVVAVLTTDAPVRAGISYSADGALSSLPVWPAQALSSTIVVAP